MKMGYKRKVVFFHVKYWNIIFTGLECSNKSQQLILNTNTIDHLFDHQTVTSHYDYFELVNTAWELRLQNNCLLFYNNTRSFPFQVL